MRFTDPSIWIKEGSGPLYWDVSETAFESIPKAREELLFLGSRDAV